MDTRIAPAKPTTLIDMTLDHDGVARRVVSIDDLLDSEAVCSLLGVSSDDLDSMHRRNAGPSCIVVDETVFYRRSEVTTWMALAERASGRAAA